MKAKLVGALSAVKHAPQHQECRAGEMAAALPLFTPLHYTCQAALPSLPLHTPVHTVA